VQANQRPIATGIEPFSEEMRFVLGQHASTVAFVACDICDAAAVRSMCSNSGADAIIHVAGYVGHEASIADPARTYAVNIGGTVNIMEAARRTGIRKVVLISSNAVYQKKQYEPIDERHPITSIYSGNPNAHYGTAKMAGEQIGLAYYSFHGMDVTALRITAVYGFGMRAPMFIKPMVEGAVRGERVTIASGGAMGRDYTYVEDAAAGIVDVLNSDTEKLEQRVYNLSYGALVSAAEIAALVRRAVPNADVTIGSELTELERANVAQRAALTSEAAHQIFGYKPRYSIEAGIKDYVRLQQRFLGG
jgi:UDP-glucose 4-epimerase